MLEVNYYQLVKGKVRIHRQKRMRETYKPLIGEPTNSVYRLIFVALSAALSREISGQKSSVEMSNRRCEVTESDGNVTHFRRYLRKNE